MRKIVPKNVRPQMVRKIYTLGVRDCDSVTASVVRAAGKFYDDKLLPINSFTSTKLYHTNPVLWSIINE